LLNVNKFYRPGQKNQCYLFCIMRKFVQCGKYFLSHAVPPYTSFTVFGVEYDVVVTSDLAYRLYFRRYIFILHRTAVFNADGSVHLMFRSEPVELQPLVSSTSGLFLSRSGEVSVALRV
jgi:hypothetical protein